MVISNLPDQFAVIIALGLEQHEIESNHAPQHSAHIHAGASSHSSALRAFHNFVFPHLVISNLPDHFAVIIALEQHEIESNHAPQHSAHIHAGASSHSSALRAFHNFVFLHLVISNLPDHFAVIIALKQHEIESNHGPQHSAHIHPGASSHSSALRAFHNFVFLHMGISNLPDQFAVIIALGLEQHEIESNHAPQHSAHIHAGASSHSSALRAFHNFVFPHLVISNLPDHFAVIIALKEITSSIPFTKHLALSQYIQYAQQPVFQAFVVCLFLESILMCEGVKLQIESSLP